MSEDFNFFKDKRFIEAFQKHKPHLVHLEKLIQKIKYGRLTLVMRVHNGQVTDLTVISGQRIRYDLGKSKPPEVEPVEPGEIEKEIADQITKP